MRTIKLTIEYDGTNYVGWQVQPNGLAIQAVIEGALARILGETVRIHSSGRTDAGVHALGMVASFKTLKTIPLQAFSDGLNAFLPPDIAIRDAEEQLPGFNPRHDARGKHYRYSISTTPRRSPLTRLCVWHIREKLDLEAMRAAAAYFVGEHDFAAFRTTGCAAKTTMRRIDSVMVDKHGDLITVDVHGSGFLKNMVRMMVGTLVAVGRGKLAPEVVARLLAAPESASAGATAPPHGLCLVEVYY